MELIRNIKKILMTNTEVKPIPFCLTKTIIQADRGSATAD